VFRRYIRSTKKQVVATRFGGLHSHTNVAWVFDSLMNLKLPL